MIMNKISKKMLDMIENGNVYLPRHAEWVHDFVEECASFPNIENIFLSR